MRFVEQSNDEFLTDNLMVAKGALESRQSNISFSLLDLYIGVKFRTSREMKLDFSWKALLKCLKCDLSSQLKDYSSSKKN
jgi:hypothetical protein